MDYKLNIRDRRGDNRYFIDNIFLKDWGAKLGPHCIAVYNALAMYANADTQEAWPSFQTIADLVGMSRRQVMREIDKLKDNGIIRVEDRKEIAPETGKPYFLSNVFTMLHPSEWGKQIEKCLHEGSDCESLGVMTDSHQPSDSESHPLVTVSHPNNTNSNNTQLTTKIAPKKIASPEQNKLFLILAGLCRIELKVATDKQIGQLDQAAKALVKTVKDSDQFKEKFGIYWLTVDWRGKQGQPPTPAQVREAYGDYCHWLEHGQQNGVKQNGSNQRSIGPLQRTGEALEGEPTYDPRTKELVYPGGHRVPAVS